MFVGHYAPALALKRWEPRAPLWALFLGVQLVDVAWAIFINIGLEEVRFVPGITASNHLDLVYMPYTHSLVAAFAWAVGAGAIAWRALPGRALRIGTAIAVAVISHWALDLVVHRPDLAIYDDHWKLGFGLWNYRWTAFVVELGALGIGFALYATATRPRDRSGSVWLWVLAGALAASQVFQLVGTPPSSALGTGAAALAAYVAFAVGAGWVDRHRSSSQ